MWVLKVCRGGEALKPKTSRARVVASGGFKTSGLAGACGGSRYIMKIVSATYT